MKGKYFVALGVSLLAIGAAAGFVGTKHVVETRAYDYTDITFYYAVSSATVGDYTVKANVKRQNGDSDWSQVPMEKTAYSYAQKDIYSVTVACTPNVWNIDFQLYNGKSFVSEVHAIAGDAATSAFSGKIYDGSSWIAQSYSTIAGFKSATVYLDWFDWGNVYLYSFETISEVKYEPYGSFPGMRLTPTDSNLIFNGGRLQAATVKYDTLANAKFIFSDGTNRDDHKSADSDLAAGHYYWNDKGAWKNEGGDLASAAAFVNDLNTARMAVAEDGVNHIKAYSICGLNASTWVNRYNDLEDGVRTYVDAATIHTYADADSTGADADVAFADIMDTLSERASGGGILSIDNPGESKAAPVITIAVIAAIVGVGFVSFVALRRKKINL